MLSSFLINGMRMLCCLIIKYDALVTYNELGDHNAPKKKKRVRGPILKLFNGQLGLFYFGDGFVW